MEKTKRFLKDACIKRLMSKSAIACADHAYIICIDGGPSNLLGWDIRIVQHIADDEGSALDPVNPQMHASIIKVAAMDYMQYMLCVSCPIEITSSP